MRPKSVVTLFFAALPSVVAFSCGGGYLLDNEVDGGSPESDATVDGAARDGSSDATSDQSSSHDASVGDAGGDAGLGADSGDAGLDGDAADGALPACPNPDVVTGSMATGFQIDSTHSGAQHGDTLSLPLCRRWVRTFEGDVSYPVVVGGRVFVTVDNAANNAVSLYALDEHTGATLWGPSALVTNDFGWAAPAYADGQLYTLTTYHLDARDPATGALLWSMTLTQLFSTDPPTAASGMIFVNATQSGSTLYGVASDGGVRWSIDSREGTVGAPAFDGHAVYGIHGCNNAFAVDPSDGGTLWKTAMPTCTGDAPVSGTIVAGRIYQPDAVSTNYIRDPADGGIVGTFGPDGGSVQSAPAGDANVLLTVGDGVLHAEQPADGSALWTFAGDGKLTGNPIVVGHQIVVGSRNGNLYVLNEDDGLLVDSTTLPAPVRTTEYSVVEPGFAAADGMLFVPATQTLAF